MQPEVSVITLQKYGKIFFCAIKNAKKYICVHFIKITIIMWWRSILLSSLFIGALLASVPHLLWLVSSLIGRLAHLKVPYAPFGWTALALVAILWASMFSGRYIGMWRIRVNNIEYADASVPAEFDGYRIVHISDLHVDTYDQNPEALAKVVERVNAQDPDIILFTGDMMTGGIGSVFQHSGTLRQLSARDGVKSVMGNHDFFIYDFSYRNNSERMAAADSLAAFEKDVLGWEVLRNRSMVLHRGADSLAIAGVDNTNGNQGFQTIQMGDLGKATEGLDGTFTVMMTHDPSHWAAEVLPRSQARITLSGHTHAAQVRILGWSLAKLMFRECDGRYDGGCYDPSYEGRMLYVNAGIGCTAPFRIGCPSEITVITLRHRQTAGRLG